MILIMPKYKINIIFYIALFFLCSFRLNLFAAPAQFEKIQELQKQERQLPPESIVRPSVEYKAEGLRDPFKEPGAGERRDNGVALEPVVSAAPPALTVQGLIWGGNTPLAIINDSVVKVGNAIEGAKITGINKEGVTVLFEGVQNFLSSPAGSSGIKKPEGG